MKDKKLEEQFNGYFEGVNTPDISITEDAKKYVRKPSRLPRLAKIASIAAGVVICVTATALISVNIANKSDGGSMPPPESSAPAIRNEYYGDGELVTVGVNAFNLSEINRSLKFIEKLSLASNAAVTADKSDFSNGDLALVHAKASYVNGVRYDADIYVEFTEKVYSPLSEFTKGEEGSYLGTKYLLTREISDNGEPVNKLFVERGGVKYYFNVQSSDYDSYLKCLQLLG